MEEQEKPSDSAPNGHSMQFNIGKSLGLEGKKTERDDFIKKVKEIHDAFNQKRAAEVTELKAHCKEIKEIAAKLKTDIEKDFQEVLKNSNELLKDIKPLLTADLQENQDLYQKAKALYTLRFDRFERNCKQALESETLLETQLAAFQLKLDALVKQTESGQQEYLDLLEQNKLNFNELESGYRYGFALKTAFEEKS